TQYQIDDAFPRFVEQLCAAVNPHVLAPVPAMAIARFEPAAGADGGFALPRRTRLWARECGGAATECEFRTCHGLVLWPVEVHTAVYRDHAQTRDRDLPPAPDRGAVLRLVFRTRAARFSALAGGMQAGGGAAGPGFDTLSLHLAGADAVPDHLYQALLADVVAVHARPADESGAQWERLADGAISRAGFTDEEAMLPFGPETFQGYRLLQEFLAFPQR